MRRLVRLTVILSMGIAGLCAAARAYGQVAALPENIAPSLQTFERCGELPCILGIIPGETSWEVAQSRLADYDSYTYDARFLRVQIRDFGAIVLHRSVD